VEMQVRLVPSLYTRARARGKSTRITVTPPPQCGADGSEKG
jgi:hypothetical protein